MIDELITPDEYAQMKSEYESKIEALSRRADEIRNNKSKANADRDNFYNIADAVSLAA